MSMNLLAIDASTEALSVALRFNGEMYDFFDVCPQQHSQKMLPVIDELLGKAKCKLKDLDGIVFGRGPGSFTGVRIGVAIAQGLAFSSNLKLVGVSTLQAMAQQAYEQTGVDRVLAGIDARMDEIYVCDYALDDGIMQPLCNESVIKPEELNCTNKPELAVGTAWETYPNALELLGSITMSKEITLPDARYMLKIAEADFMANQSVEAANAQPHYVRDTVSWKKLPGRE
ncbi:Inactive homolog of metal-dependent proteases,putative molecular chaperone [Pseudoalteromonas luteoviolacea B = ATCC 29581]|nr:Inactive homolog of metal-dependent proteases,putative molecular chaperone [Pseudoalteromonas luteoviolacea B = ATCC 29581]